jgi:hypothetical protein
VGGLADLACVFRSCRRLGSFRARQGAPPPCGEPLCWESLSGNERLHLDRRRRGRLVRALLIPIAEIAAAGRRATALAHDGTAFVDQAGSKGSERICVCRQGILQRLTRGHHPWRSLPVMNRSWDATAPGILRLPSGRLLRGRGLRRPLREDSLPEFAVYLLGDRPPPVPWDARWVRWPDFRLPSDRRDTQDALREAWRRAEAERVEVACGGGRGRTGTALACIAVLDGVPAREAVAFVREYYDPRAVETPWQRRYVSRFHAA